MIIIVAPYSPPGKCPVINLGAARKLEVVMQLLHQIDSRIILVNSAHNDTSPSELSIRNIEICNVKLTEITPPIYKSRVFGKLLNLFSVNAILDSLGKQGKPTLLWVYNGYAFEMLVAREAWKRYHIPMILEFEDWPLSRSRGFNPKPYIDYFFWRISVKRFSGSFAVNESLAKNLRDAVGIVELLPGIVPRALSDISTNALPFISDKDVVHVGYFGGLSLEKGADIVLQLAKSLPVDYVMHVTGTGELASNFESAALDLKGKLCYYGKVNNTTLYNVISRCDVMLNPHTSIEKMKNGVFPFKVIEAVASGRLLISTAVPSNGLEDVLIGVQFVEHNFEAFYNAITDSSNNYRKTAGLVARGAATANQRFGEKPLLEKIRKMANSSAKSK